MRRKRHITTNKVYKWKARLNLDSSRQIYGLDYDETYSPVVTWNAIRLLLTMVITQSWHTMQLNYVQAFSQAPVERDLYMKIPKGFEVEGANKDDYVLRVRKNIYGQKQAGRVWNKYLVTKLKRIGFKQSKIDECVFYKGRIMYILYTDDSILAGPKKLD